MMTGSHFKRRVLALSVAAIALWTSLTPAQGPNATEITRILGKLRQTYTTLPAWDVEHRIVIEGFPRGVGPVKLADIKLRTSNSEPAAGGQGLNGICAGRCRLEWETVERGRVLLVRDGQATWLYSSARNEFVKGEALRDVASSVSSAMLLSVHMTPLRSFDEQQWTNVRLLESETLTFGGARRECYVVEASLKSQGVPWVTQPGSTPPVDPNMVFTAAGSLAQLGVQALSQIIVAPVPGTVVYYASAQAGEFPRLRLWIDKERGLVLQRTVTENTRRFVRTAASTTEIPVELRLTDTFTAINIGAAVPEALFRFEPPSEAKQVPRQ